MRRVVSCWLLISIAATFPCHAQEQNDLSLQVAQLNRILVLLVRAEVISQRLMLDQAELKDLVQERGKLDVDIEESSSWSARAESQAAQLESESPEMARQQRSVIATRQLRIAELRSRREVVEGAIRSTRSRIDKAVRRLESIDGLLDALSPGSEPKVKE